MSLDLLMNLCTVSIPSSSTSAGHTFRLERMNVAVDARLRSPRHDITRRAGCFTVDARFELAGHYARCLFTSGDSQGVSGDEAVSQSGSCSRR